MIKVDSSPEQRIAITKVIVELTDPSRSSGLFKNKPRRRNKFEDGAMVFYHNDHTTFLSTIMSFLCHRENKGCRAEVSVLDPEFSLNNISLSILDIVGIPWNRITRQPTKVFRSGGNCTYTVGFVNLNLTVG